MKNNNNVQKQEEILFPLNLKELHLVKILRSILYGELTVSKQNGEYTIASVNQKIRLETDIKKQVVSNDARNVGVGDDPNQL